MSRIFFWVKDIHDVIMHAKFGDDCLWGSGVVAGQISAFPIDFAGRPYNTLTLPCERVIWTTLLFFHLQYMDRHAYCIFSDSAFLQQVCLTKFGSRFALSGNSVITQLLSSSLLYFHLLFFQLIKFHAQQPHRRHLHQVLIPIIV